VEATILWIAMLAGCVLSAWAGGRLGPRAGQWGAPRTIPRAAGQVVAGVLAGIGLTLAVSLATNLRLVTKPDEAVLAWVVEHRDPLMVLLQGYLTEVGGIGTTLSVALLGGALLAYRHRSVALGALPTLAFVVLYAAQWLIERVDDRPPPPLDTAIGGIGGFPSGGVARDVVIFGLLAYLMRLSWTRRSDRSFLGALLFVIVFVEAFSRLMLGRHWSLDLLGGVTLGVGILFGFVRLADLTVARRAQRSSETTAVAQ
jgi:membrane-associated phospholipid phosphatase